MRQGRKSAAQTKAPLKDRIKGSNVNKKGSASSTSTAKAIILSDEITEALSKKAEEYNKKNKNKVSLNTLKAVFRRGAGAFSTSHRPNMTRNGWAYARVNKFLEKKGGKSVKKAYIQDDDLLENGGQLGQEVVCVNCGWHWNTTDSDEYDKYVCHKCGFDNSLFYSNDIMAKGGKTKGGDCYLKAGSFCLLPSKHDFIGEPYLVHAEVRGQGSIEGLRYGHAWVEDDENVYDYSNGRNIVMPKQIYYLLGDIKTENPKKYQRYSFPEARAKMFETKHYGSWDIETDYAGGGLIAPNGKLSNLTPEQYKLVRTPEFKAWFGDWENDPQNASKVVDENGEPKTMYHGSRGNFTIFSDENENKLPWTQGGVGFYFTSNYNYAFGYGENVISAFINARNIKNEKYDFTFITKDNFNILKDNKFDSIYFDGNFTKIDRERGIKYDELVVFEPNQIKLADGTNTTFDANNPDIRFNKGGLILGKKYTGKEVKKYLESANYKDNTFFEYIKNSDKYFLENIDIKSILDQDSSLHDFVTHSIDTISPNDNESEWNNKFPIVIGDNNYDKNNVVLDGYHRIAQAIVNGENEIIAFVKSENYEEGGLIAPNGKASNLTPEQYKLVRTPQFKAWFGDWENDPKNASKVVDENGEPLVVYHSSNKNFNTFKKDKVGSNFDYSFGFHFSNSINDSKEYGKNTKYVFLNLRNPKIYNVNDGQNGSVFIDMNMYDAINNIVNSRKNKEKEIDGVIAYSETNGYVVMYPNQIKLADGTNTTFDANNQDIRYKQGGLITPKKYLYHKSNPIFRNNILKQGLIPKAKSETWLSNTNIKGEAIFATNSDKKKDWFNTTYDDDIYQIDTTNLKNKWYLDPNFKDSKYVFTLEPIDKSFIKLIYKGTGESYKQGGLTNNDMNNKDIRYKKGGQLKPAKSLLQIAKEKKVTITYAFEQLKKGMEFEKEHSDDKKVQKTIALQHLDENIDYYKKLAKMESTFAKGGEIDADNPKIKNEMIHKSGKVGGLLVGKRHSEGGIKAINKSNNSPLEMEGGEVVITRNAVSDNTKREFEGEMLTNREILSRINEGGGGVSFAKGGDVPEHIMVSGKEYKYGGKTLKDSEIVDYCGCKHKMAEGGTTESSVFRGYEIGDDGTYRKPNTKNFGIKYPELKPSEAFAKIYGNKYKNGGKVESIVIIDKSVPSYNDFKNNNKNINLHITKSEYKKYLNNNYKVDFDHLPNTIRMGLLLGNQKLVDKYINA